MIYLGALLYFSLSWRYGDCFPLEDYNLTAKIGGHVVFNCPLDFPMDIVVPYILEWRKDNQLIFSWYDEMPHAVDTYGGRIQLLHTGEWGLGQGSINLTSIRETDNGYYHCLVIFPNRSPPLRNNGTYFFLEVEGANLLVTPPMNVTCLEGSRAEFECVPKSLDLFVKWYKDGDPISDLMDLAYRSTLESNGSLVIDPTMMNDLGEYECHVSNDVNDVQIASAYLNVEYKAKVVYAPPERYLAFGKPASLDCHYAANPPLTNLRWEKDGFLFDPYNVPGVFYSRNGSLLFNKIDESHEGYYSCTPYNRLGTEGPSPKIRVVVQKPAIFLVRPQPIYLTRIGGKVEMNCVASDGYIERPPYIKWRRKDGIPLPEHRTSIENGNITIVDISEEDRGIYVCSASNEADTITTETEIMIDHVAPRAPYNLTATVGKTFFRVHWVEGYKRQHKDVYVWYRATDGTEWRTLKIVEHDITEATVHNLRPGQEYEIRILSQDYVGDGLFSKSLKVMTLDEDMNELLDVSMRSSLSTGPPINLTARLLDDKILLTWSPPAFGPNDVHKYIVRWYAGFEENLLGSSDTHNLYFLFPGLEEDTRYTFVVFAVTSQDAQFASDKVVLVVPAYARIKAIGTIVGCVSLLIAILGFVAYVMRKNVCQKNNVKC